MKEGVYTGAIALIKVGGQVIGRMRSVRAQESVRRLPVRGLGTIIAGEQAVTEWDGTLSCEFMNIDLNVSGIPNAIRRNFSSTSSQVTTGDSSFEDQLVLDTEGVQVDMFKKVADVLNPDGSIKPMLKPFAIIQGCLIESDSFEVSEGAISGRSQSFKYLHPAKTPQ